MAIIIGAVLSLLCIAVLFYPFFKAQRAGLVAGTLENVGLENDGESPQELESVYQAIRTLQLEHQLGRIPDSSYQDQLDAYRLEAAEILRSRALAKDASRAIMMIVPRKPVRPIALAIIPPTSEPNPIPTRMRRKGSRK